MGRSFSPRAVVNYAVFGFFLLLGYKIFLGGNDKKSSDPFRDITNDHPKNVRGQSENSENVLPGADYKGQGHEGKVEEDRDPIDVGDLPKDLANDETDEKLQQKEKEYLQDQLDKHQVNLDKEKKARDDAFLPDGVDWEVEKEMVKRRSVFFQSIKEREQPMEEHEFRDMHEADDNFAFVTAGSHSTFPATIQFIYSIQYFYPDSSIGIYDIGLTSDEKTFINSLCNTEVISMWLQVWPEELYKMRHRVWRPLLIQFAAGKYAHFIYIEPGKYVYKQAIKDYIIHSRLHGVTVGGKQLKYSSFVVTNPHMYTFLTTDEKKLQKTPHFEFSVLIVHNTKRVNNFFLRYLTACTMEDYCIAPPGAKPNCDYNLGNNKKFANCHRYDESAMNLILNRWHDYKPSEYLMKDIVTKDYDGKDMSKRVKVCHPIKNDEV
ncbi:unnamed protein product [Lymnaea stagnalis]|uniref:Uncharacterized protein n=1 Tax=Lymnaea stagnalis TaxID=6523 RepID=A0AAV2HUL4_LYMST